MSAEGSNGTRPLPQSNGSQTPFNMAKGVEENGGERRKRVLVVGAGAAGKQIRLYRRNWL